MKQPITDISLSVTMDAKKQLYLSLWIMRDNNVSSHYYRDVSAFDRCVNFMKAFSETNTSLPDSVLTSGELANMVYGDDWMTEAIAREADAQEFRDVKFGSKQWFDDLEETPF